MHSNVICKTKKDIAAKLIIWTWSTLRV